MTRFTSLPSVSLHKSTPPRQNNKRWQAVNRCGRFYLFPSSPPPLPAPRPNRPTPKSLFIVRQMYRSQPPPSPLVTSTGKIRLHTIWIRTPSPTPQWSDTLAISRSVSQPPPPPPPPPHFPKQVGIRLNPTRLHCVEINTCLMPLHLNPTLL